jgi:hypothetical protein
MHDDNRCEAIGHRGPDCKRWPTENNRQAPNGCARRWPGFGHRGRPVASSTSALSPGDTTLPGGSAFITIRFRGGDVPTTPLLSALSQPAGVGAGRLACTAAASAARGAVGVFVGTWN